jgi:hypothetical protein
LSMSERPELATTLVFDELTVNVTPFAPVSTSPTVKLTFRAVFRGVVYAAFRPVIVGGVSIVTTCAAEVWPLADTVIVGLPITVLRYRKLAVDAPAGIVTDVMFAVFAAFRKVPEPDVARLTTCAPVVIATPPNVWRSTVMRPLDVPAGVVCGVVVNTNFGRPTIVTPWVPAVYELLPAVIVGVPGLPDR